MAASGGEGFWGCSNMPQALSLPPRRLPQARSWLAVCLVAMQVPSLHPSSILDVLH